jgi:hypothetical protein
MSSDFDPSEFIDHDLRSGQAPAFSSTALPGKRAPSREEMEQRVSDTQLKLAELKRAQEELERERAQIEDLRRRQNEYQTGREEMIQNLARGVGLLEESSFSARRDAEQMAKSIGDMRVYLEKIQALNQDSWTAETLNVELTRALTTIENARMEWNAALLKFPVLGGNGNLPREASSKQSPARDLSSMTFGQLCRVGIALTWPLVLLGFVIVILLMTRK